MALQYFLAFFEILLLELTKGMLGGGECFTSYLAPGLQSGGEKEQSPFWVVLCSWEKHPEPPTAGLLSEIRLRISLRYN